MKERRKRKRAEGALSCAIRSVAALQTAEVEQTRAAVARAEARLTNRLASAEDFIKQQLIPTASAVQTAARELLLFNEQAMLEQL